MQIDTTILAALIALFGTLITVYVGYRQWKYQQEKNYLPIFQTERYETYRKLWALLPDLSAKANKSRQWSKDNYSFILLYSEEELNSTCEEVRLFLAKNELQISDEDSLLVIQYLENALTIKNLVSKFETQIHASSPPKIRYPKGDQSLERVLAYNYRNRKYFVLQIRLMAFIYSVKDGMSMRAIRNPSPIGLLLATIFTPEWSYKIGQIYKAHNNLKESRKKLLIRFRQVSSGKA